MRRILLTLVTSPIGRKCIMALTGLGAIAFLTVHLAGNLLIFAGRDAFNAYAHRLHAVPLLPLFELGLLGLFLVHIGFGLVLTWENWRARPTGYSRRRTAGGAEWASATMIYSGLAVLCFLGLHLWTVRFGVSPTMEAYDKVLGALTNPVGQAGYVLGILFLGLHLYHGASSTLLSLGLHDPRLDAAVVLGGRAAAVAFTLLFGAIPVFVQFFLQRLG